MVPDYNLNTVTRVINKQVTNGCPILTMTMTN